MPVNKYDFLTLKNNFVKVKFTRDLLERNLGGLQAFFLGGGVQDNINASIQRISKYVKRKGDMSSS
jgi:hypothetical protein